MMTIFESVLVWSLFGLAIINIVTFTNYSVLFINGLFAVILLALITQDIIDKYFTVEKGHTPI